MSAQLSITEANLPLLEVNVPPLSVRPLTVAGLPTAPQDLSGTWKFNPSMPAGGVTTSADVAKSWRDIQVPGEWVMQGLTVTPESPAAYLRTFMAADQVTGQRVKLRFSAVYSLCRVWVNGVAVGGHEGGFVPFECDITDAIRTGENTLLVSVQSESQLDRLSCGSQYAGHPLGGISRKVQLFSVPAVHLANLMIETSFDPAFQNAVLTARFLLRNQSTRASSGAATCAIAAESGATKSTLISASVSWHDLAPGGEFPMTVSLPVTNPAKWDCEHPNLHTLAITAKDIAGVEETVEEIFGFRQIEVKGRRVLVNGTPIKLFGVCRHEVHPLLGRTLTPQLWQQDAELYRTGNCNFIRTSHYPPAEEFLQQCDRLGLFVELEAPICWVGQATPLDPAIYQRLAQANVETVQGYPNHPSVIIRSLGNESAWSLLFAQVHALIRQADPTRPTTFHDQCWGPDNNFGSKELPIAVIHYPGPNGATDALQETRPVLFGEYCHLNSYNRRELLSDPSLRDLWGQGLEMMRERMSLSEPVLGGAIWAAMDDTFFPANGDTVGYGTWGPLDAWRRPKPEYLHMKKAYSPLRLRSTCIPVPAPGRPVVVTIENRHNFSDLNELRFVWKVAGQSGTATTVAAPGHEGRLEIPVAGTELEGKLLEINALNPRGFTEDTWQIALGSDPRMAPPLRAGKTGALRLDKTDKTFVIHGVAFALTIDAVTGAIQATGSQGRAALTSGPDLLLLPLNDDNCGGIQMQGKEKDVALYSDSCHGWQASSVTAREISAGVEVRISGTYVEAGGTFTFMVTGDGGIAAHYRFSIAEKTELDPRQIGVVFSLPADCQTLSWRRKAQWSAYPDDHIGRPAGTAAAFIKGLPMSGLAGPRVQPARSWSQDSTPYGTNDFRSTKMNIFEASLMSAAGNGVRVCSDGTQHVRSWVENANVRLLVADYCNEGAATYFSEHVIPHQPLKSGFVVEGMLQLEIH
jgi:hypothetical protein